MKNPLVLTYDIGTQSLRSMLVNQHGEIVAFVQEKYEVPYIVKQEGFAEQSPNFYFNMMCKTSNELKKENEELFKDIIAVTVTCIRNTVVFLDKNNNPLRDIILWVDSRRSNKELPLSKFKVDAFKMVKKEEMLTSLYQDFKSVWVQEFEPEVWAKTKKYVMLPTFINYQLTGQLKDTPANMIAPLPFDVKTRDWDKKNTLQSQLVSLPLDMMCELVESGEVIGNINSEVSNLLGIPTGLPLIATGSDKGCETLGLSVIKKNQAAISFGTIATIQFATDKYFEVLPFTPSFPAVLSNQYNPETQIYRGFWMITWFKQNFAELECKRAEKLGCIPEDLLNEKLKDIPVGCNGLMLQPYWGACLLDSTAKGSLIGFSDVHTKYHIYRAIIEGIGMTLLAGLQNMEKRSGQKIEEIYVGGGGSQSEDICQIMADIFNMPVKRTQTHEACGIGSSMCAFVSRGIFKDYDDAIAHMVTVKDTFIPDKDNNRIYNRIYKQLYGKINPKLKPIYKKMRKFDDVF